VPTHLRILCDHSADQRFVDTFERTDWITVIQVEDVLSEDAPDRDISEYAEQYGWVVFTEDDDFLDIDHNRGVVRYHPLDDSSPGDVLDALRVIVDAYDDHRDIEQRIPGRWADFVDNAISSQLRSSAWSCWWMSVSSALDHPSNERAARTSPYLLPSSVNCSSAVWSASASSASALRKISRLVYASRLSVTSCSCSGGRSWSPDVSAVATSGLNSAVMCSSSDSSYSSA
jgi:hypothetical protein